MLLHAFFRGDKQEPEVPLFQIGLDTGTVPVFKGTVVRSSRDAPCIKVVDLVLHQGDQRGDDQGQAAEEYCRKLVTQGFPAARCHDRKGVPAVKDRPGYLLLVR